MARRSLLNLTFAVTPFVVAVVDFEVVFEEPEPGRVRFAYTGADRIKTRRNPPRIIKIFFITAIS